MLFQLEALELCFIHPLGFGLTSGTKRNIIVVTSAKAGGSAGPDPRQPGRERLPPARSLRAARPGAAASSRRCSAPAALRSFGSGSFWSPRPVPVPPASKKKKKPKKHKSKNTIVSLERQPGCGLPSPSVPPGSRVPPSLPRDAGTSGEAGGRGWGGGRGGSGPRRPPPPPRQRPPSGSRCLPE